MLTAQSLIVLFGIAYAAKCGIVEVWKTFIRGDDQKNRAHHLAAGAGSVIAVTLVLSVIAQLNAISRGAPTLSTSALAGFIGGTIVAIDSALRGKRRRLSELLARYAPPEVVRALSVTFLLLDFFLAPLITALFAVALSELSDSHVFIAVAAIGYERATAATYDLLTA